MMGFNVSAAAPAIDFLKILELAADPAKSRAVLEEILAASKSLDEKWRQTDAARIEAEASIQKSLAEAEANTLTARRAAQEVARARDERDGLLAQLEGAKNSLSATSSALAAAASDLSSAKDSLEAVKSEVEAKTQELEKASAQLAEVTEKNRLADEEAAALEKRIEKARAQIAKLLG
ncbi:MAG: hypothetical protein RL268_2773 [Pseudomonadota bacterium]|jgi:chromosome segregation ATPase